MLTPNVRQEVEPFRALCVQRTNNATEEEHSPGDQPSALTAGPATSAAVWRLKPGGIYPLRQRDRLDDAVGRARCQEKWLTSTAFFSGQKLKTRFR